MLRNSDHLNWFWHPILTQWRGYAAILIASLMINILALAVPVFTMNVYDYVIPTFSHETLFIFTFGVFVALSFDFVLRMVRAHILNKISLNLEAYFDFSLIEHFIGKSREALSLGQKVKIFHELQGVRDYFSTRMIIGLVDLPFVVIFILVIYFISPALAYVPIVSIVIIVAVNMVAQIPHALMGEKAQKAAQEKSVMLLELLRGEQTIMQSNAQGFFTQGWENTLDGSVQTSRKTQLWSAFIQNFSMSMAQFTTVAILCVGVFEVEKQALSVGGLVAATILAGRVISPVINVSSLLSKYKDIMHILRMLDQVLSVPSSYSSRMKLAPLHDASGSIQVEAATYGYQDDLPNVLDGVSLSIRAGEKIAVVGPSGSGKSTLLRLVAGQITPSKGLISLDNTAYHQIPFDSLNSVIGYVPQNPFIFNSTVKDNILMGRTVDADSLKGILVTSGLSLHLGSPHFHLDKMAGENGCNLSDGQIRAIAIARVLVQDPAIILMDEPNNSMDQALEQNFINGLKTVMKDKTLVIITHKVNLLPLMDKVVVMNSGKISLDGKPTHVLKALGYKSAADGGHDV